MNESSLEIQHPRPDPGPDPRPPLTKCVLFALLIGAMIGAMVGGYVGYDVRGNMQAQMAISDFLSKPIELQVNVAGLQAAASQSPQFIVLSPSESTTAGSLFTFLAEATSKALEVAESHVKDTADIPKEAVKEFTKSLSGEAGKELVRIFSNLIKSGFKSSGGLS